MPTVSKTATLIRKTRIQRGITQQALAEQLGYNAAQNVSSWENGYSQVPPMMYKKLCKKLSIHPGVMQKTLERDYRAGLRKLLN